MAIINNASPGSQLNLLCLIYRVLNRNPNKFSLEELYGLCRPEELLWKEDHKKRFRENFNFGKNRGGKSGMKTTNKKYIFWNQ